MATNKAKTKAYPGEVEETYPDIFNIQAMPTQPLEKKPGQLPDHMIKQFFEEVALSLCVVNAKCIIGLYTSVLRCSFFLKQGVCVCVRARVGGVGWHV